MPTDGAGPSKVLVRVAAAAAAGATMAGLVVVSPFGPHRASPSASSGSPDRRGAIPVGLGRRPTAAARRPRASGQLVIAWLEERRQRWPHTANPPPDHQRPYSDGDRTRQHTFWATPTLGGRNATPDRLRIDRLLEEAVARGPDPLHLAVVFGLSEPTASVTPKQPANSSRPPPKISTIDPTAAAPR
jgi:hypothetical protein